LKPASFARALLIFSSVSLLALTTWTSRSKQCLSDPGFQNLNIKFDQKLFSIPRCPETASFGFDSGLERQKKIFLREARALRPALVFLGIDHPRRLSLSVIEPDKQTNSTIANQLLEQWLWTQVESRSMPHSEDLLERRLFQLALIKFWSALPVVPDLLDSPESVYAYRGLELMVQQLGLFERQDFFRSWYAALNANHRFVFSPTEKTAYFSRLQIKVRSEGYDLITKMIVVPLVVDLQSQLVRRESAFNVLRNTLVIKQSLVQVPWVEKDFLLKDLPAVQARKLVLFRCQMPSLNDFEFTRAQFERVLVIQDCHQRPSSFFEMAVWDLPSFASAYPEVKFVEIHWPSFKLAMQKAGFRASTLSQVLAPATLRAFYKKGLLQKLTNDPATGVQSWRGALEPFPLFRL
jgi:hypothetical protein